MSKIYITINHAIVSPTTITYIRENFQSIYKTIRRRIGSGNLYFTRDVKYLTGEVVSEPHIFITKSNTVFEIKQLSSYIYLELIGDENEGLRLRAEMKQIRYKKAKLRRKLKKQKDTSPEPAKAA